MTFERVEFSFPDEDDKGNPRKGGAVVAPEQDEQVEVQNTDAEATDIEVVDDTPPEDRGRTPLREAPEEVTDEELNRYSDKRLKDRLAHLGKGYHEERRAKEAAIREAEEARRLAQAVIEENRKLQGSLATNQTALLEQAKKVVAGELEAAERKYRTAYEAGDPDALLAAQRELTAAQIKADRVNNFKPAPLQPEEKVVQTQQEADQAPQLDPKTRQWMARNPWFESNRKMRAYALGLHEELVSQGISPASDAYFTSIDEDMKKRFPEAFAAAEPADAVTPQRTKATVVAPASRSTAPKKVVLTKTQVDLAKRLGVPLELYARKVAEEMRKE